MFRQSRICKSPRIFGRIAAAVLCSAIGLAGFAGSSNAAPDHDSAVLVKLNRAALIAGAVSGKTRGLEGELQRFYAGRDFSPVWVTRNETGATWSPRALAALSALRNASRNSLDASAYFTPRLTGEVPQSPDEQIAAELDLSRALMAYIRDLKFGRHNPRSDYGQSKSEAAGSESQALREALQHVDLKSALTDVGPANPNYDRLARHIDSYRKIVEAGGWGRLREGALLRPGTSDPRIPELRRILAIKGDLPNAVSMALGFDNRPARLASYSMADLRAGLGGTMYDADLESAVRRFQERHGLDIDGLIGSQTLDIINVPAEDRFRQIMLNLERMRWQRNVYGERHIEVNIPEFRLRGYRDGVVSVEMPVIVGRDERQTPVMNDFITNVKFNPEWNVPKSIAEKDIVPKLLSNPFHANEIGLQTLRGGRLANPLLIDWLNPNLGQVRFRQPPGPKNPLGQMRFSMTNDQAIYLHDTPNKYLFTQNQRGASSGCVRVGDPKMLAKFLISQPDIDGQWIDDVIQTIETQFVRLQSPVPVSLNYYTAFVSPDGVLNFRADIYGKDLELAAKMI